MDRELPVRAVAANGARREGGFTLLELLVSVGLFVVITGSIYSLLHVGTSDRFTTNQRAELLQNARIALNSIGQDALNAGFDFPNGGAVSGEGSLAAFGVVADGDADKDMLVPVLARDDVNANALSPTPGTLTDQVTFAYIDDSFNVDANNNPQALSIGARGGTQSRLLTVQTPPAVDPTRAGDLYVISDASSATLGYCTAASATTLTFLDTSADPLGVNYRPGGANLFTFQVTPPARLRRVRCVTYFVDNGGTLVRRTAGSAANLGGNVAATGGFLDMPLAQGIENMQLEYVLQNGDVVAAPTPLQMATIRQIRVALQVRSPEPDQRTREHYRMTLATTLNARNIGYRR
jgi:hypothetical protein